MKARVWQQYLDEQRRLHGKVLFTVTELANVARSSRHALNVELARLRRQGVIVQYAQGLYGPPGAVTPEALLTGMDAHAYITGFYALYAHRLITQAPSRIACFTDRRSPRARERKTPVGDFVFHCVRSRVYAPPPGTVLAPPEQSLCDYIYLLRRDGVRPESQVTFRNLEKLQTPVLQAVADRYPRVVARHALAVVAAAR